MKLKIIPKQVQSLISTSLWNRDFFSKNKSIYMYMTMIFLFLNDEDHRMNGYQKLITLVY